MRAARIVVPSLIGLATVATIAWAFVWGESATFSLASRLTPPKTSIEMLGMLALPDEATDGADAAVQLTGLSGITWLGDDAWAAVMDNSNRLITFSLALAADGSPLAVKNLRVVTLAATHDYEDLAPCPPDLEKRIARRLMRRGLPDPGPCVLVCEEDTPAIRGVALRDGSLVGIVPLPAILQSHRPNRSLESLSIDPNGLAIWTANEEALPNDGPPPTETTGTVVRLVSIPIPTDGEPHGNGPAAAERQFAYPVDSPHTFLRVINGAPFSGVVALVALGQGRLLVMERSGTHGLPPFENRIYFVNTADSQDVSTIQRDLAIFPKNFVSKRLLWKDALGYNFEGLALGPTLADGSQFLVAIADNGGLGTLTQLVTFKLHHEPPHRTPGPR